VCAQEGEIALGLNTHTKASIWRQAGDAEVSLVIGELGKAFSTHATR